MKSRIQKTLMIGALVGITLALSTGCSKKEDSSNSDTTSSGGATNPMDDKGVGPITEVKLEALNPTLAGKGKAVFQAKCSMCHKVEEKFVGPALKGVTQRRRPEWIMNMVLNPAEMTQKDPIAKDLLAQHLTQMSFQNVNQEDVRQILEFFRQNDATAK